MRGKRSKQYRKLMQQYGMSFGFREPYQVLVDADIIRDADRFKMDLVGGLERTLHGQVKPMITQCSMRHLYAAASEPGVSFLIDKAKLFERRRCDHRPEEYPEPLSTEECLASVVDPKGSKTNKHRYVVASQELNVRKRMRGIMGTPLVYIARSVMIMEPMAGATAESRDREERDKFRDGLKGGRGSGSLKRKRGEDGGEASGELHNAAEDKAPKKKSKFRDGPKAPNPLAIKKSKKKNVDGQVVTSASKESTTKEPGIMVGSQAAEGSEPNMKRKRKRLRKHTSGVEGIRSVEEADEADVSE